MESNAVRARRNEDRVLIAVGLVGWLTVAQVAAWVWPDSGMHSATNRAAEVPARLSAGRLLMRRKSGTGADGPDTSTATNVSET